MGRVLAPLGVDGWVKLYTYTETLGSLGGHKTWWVGRDEDSGYFRDFREVVPAGFAVQGKSVVAKFSDCEDRDAALALKGSVIAVLRASLPENDEGEYYWADLIGLEVVRTDGRKLGEVAELLETGANDVLLVTGRKEGRRELLIPFIASAVIEVDLAERRICVDWEE
ncbi:MAG: ribosome maturation factor RimM [Burkholderiales bacterium]|nr:ribosome maturation factor RimM [Burkholderiales bacterium]